MPPMGKGRPGSEEGQPRLSLGDLVRKSGDLLLTHTGIDVVALRRRSGRRRARLRDKLAARMVAP